MKTITVTQWQRMKPRGRSWLVARAFGEKVRVFWECYTVQGARFGGSHDSKSYCDSVIEACNKLTKAQAHRQELPFPHPLKGGHAKPSAGFGGFAEYDHLAFHCLRPLMEEGLRVEVAKDGNNYVLRASHHGARSSSLADAAALLFCKVRGIVAEGGAK